MSFLTLWFSNLMKRKRKELEKNHKVGLQESIFNATSFQSNTWLETFLHHIISKWKPWCISVFSEEAICIFFWWKKKVQKSAYVQEMWRVRGKEEWVFIHKGSLVSIYERIVNSIQQFQQIKFPHWKNVYIVPTF